MSGLFGRSNFEVFLAVMLVICFGVEILFSSLGLFSHVFSWYKPSVSSNSLFLFSQIHIPTISFVSLQMVNISSCSSEITCLYKYLCSGVLLGLDVTRWSMMINLASFVAFITILDISWTNVLVFWVNNKFRFRQKLNFRLSCTCEKHITKIICTNAFSCHSSHSSHIFEIISFLSNEVIILLRWISNNQSIHIFLFFWSCWKRTSIAVGVIDGCQWTSNIKIEDVSTIFDWLKGGFRILGIEVFYGVFFIDGIWVQCYARFLRVRS